MRSRGIGGEVLNKQGICTVGVQMHCLPLFMGVMRDRVRDESLIHKQRDVSEDLGMQTQVDLLSYAKAYAIISARS